MAEVQLRQLRVSADLDPTAYKAGMDVKIAADRAGAASSAAVAVAVTATDQKLSQAGNGAERLSRLYIDGYASAQKFQSELRSLATNVERGRTSMTQASAILDGLYRKFNMTADASSLAARGQVELAAAVERANAKLQAQAVIKTPGFDVGALRASQIGANFASDLNSRLGIGGQAASARASASVFEEAAREAERYQQQATTLRAALDPVGASQARMNAEIAEYTVLMNRAEISTTEFAQAQAMAKSRHDLFVASLDKTLSPANDNDGQFRRQNLGYQAFDIGQGLASGMPPAMILAQQGPQIAQLYAGQGGASAAIKDLGVIAASAISTVGALPLALVVAGTAAVAYFKSAGASAKTTEEALKDHQENIRALAAAYGVAERSAQAFSQADQAVAAAAAQGSLVEVLEKQVEAARELRLEFGTIQTRGRTAQTMFELGPDFKVFQPAFETLDQGIRAGKINARGFIDEISRISEANPQYDAFGDKILRSAETFLKLRTEAEKTRDIFSQIQAMQLPTLDPLNVFDADRDQTDRANRIPSMFERQRAALESARLSATAISPQEKAAAARAAAEGQFNDSESSTARANRIELAEKQALIAAEQSLAQAQIERQRQSASALAQAQFEASLVGVTIAERNRLMAAYQAEAQIREAASRAGVAADEKEIALAREKAGAVVDLNAKIAATKLLQDQSYQVEQLRLEAQLVGASAQQRAQLTAALQAEQQLRQQGIDTTSREAQAYIANAQAMAQARLEIERQNAAYASLQQAGGSAIDSLTVGTGSLRDRLKSAADTMLQWVQQMTIANPLKNALFGSNLPTMGDLFSGRPSIPGATTTGSMMVTAGTVMVNGGVMGGQFPSAPGLPSATTTSGSLSSVLGLPANVNGVRPDLVSSGIVNSPVSSIAPTSQAMMYRQAISQIESGSYEGNYNAIGPLTRSGDRAYGRYQVMGNNVGPWSEKYYGERLTPQQYLANQKAQDAVFDGEFGADAAKYGPAAASTKWFTGSPVAKGRVDVNGMSDTRYSAQFTSNMQKLSQTTAATSKDLGTLGDTSSKVGTQITDGLGKMTTAVPAVTPPATATAPTGGGNIFSSLFGGIFKLFGFADGTDFSPGGTFMVGERGRELVTLPRGSQVTPNHKMPLNSEQRQRGGPMRLEYTINVAGNGDKELMERMRLTAETTVAGGIAQYHSRFGDYVEEYQQNPENRGAA